MRSNPSCQWQFWWQLDWQAIPEEKWQIGFVAWPKVQPASQLCFRLSSLSGRMLFCLLGEMRTNGKPQRKTHRLAMKSPFCCVHSAPGGEQVWRYGSVTVWRGVCLTRSEETQT
jgi:hypothetical protein